MKKINEIQEQLEKEKIKYNNLNYSYKTLEKNFDEMKIKYFDLKNESEFNSNIKEILEELEKNILQSIKLKEYGALHELIEIYLKLRNEVK